MEFLNPAPPAAGKPQAGGWAAPLAPLCALAAAFFLFSGSCLAGPYAPAAGQPGSTAVSKDDPALRAWASGWTEYIPGTEVSSTWQTPQKALGKAAGDSYDVVSLGNGGRITLTFERPIANGAGWDFAVFENAFGDNFLELAWVEVSSDGIHFARFDNRSLTPGPVGSFGAVDPTDIDGLAGKYRQGWGTPFDLSDLAGKPEVRAALVDLGAITHVRLIDLVGDGSASDSAGNPIYDPHPTSQSAGFDLDAVGVRHVLTENSPPAAPGLLSPADGATGVPLEVTLRSGAFRDPDEGDGDFHFQSRWQVAEDEAFTNLRVDLVTPHALTELPLSALWIPPGKNLYWRIQHIDGRGVSSPWSEVFSFTTTAVPRDGNDNGIPDEQELAPGNPADLNGDGIPDVRQVSERFKVFAAAAGGGEIALSVAEDDAVIEAAQAFDLEDLPAGANAPEDTLLGLVGMRIRLPAPGRAATLTVHLSQAAPAGYAWFKYDAIRGWREVAAARFRADRRAVTLPLEDGGALDGDGRADGVIVDPGGVALAGETTGSPPPDGKAGVGGGGCFLAAVAAGASGPPGGLALLVGLAAAAAGGGLRRRR
ncbi:MAG: choice-of-anchor U domain-containing protein [Desulfobacterales bacterium]